MNIIAKVMNFEKAWYKKFNEYDALINDKTPNKLCTALQQRVNELEACNNHTLQE